jgi:hypothetical protein
MANVDSITISNTIGMDNNIIARLYFPSVKSCSVPDKDSQTSLKNCFILFDNMTCKIRLNHKFHLWKTNKVQNDEALSAEINNKIK